MLRPNKLVRFDDGRLEAPEARVEGDELRDMQTGDKAKNTEGFIETQGYVPGETPAMMIDVTQPEIPRGETGARYLLKRTPSNYLLNQAYGLWVFFSLFILTLIMTRKVSVAEYGIYAIASAAFNTIAYIVAFGLEDATTTFVPRVFAEHGKAAAALLIRRLLTLRIATLVISIVVMLFGLQVLAAIIAAIPIAGSAGMAAG